LGCTGMRATSAVALTNVTARARFHGIDNGLDLIGWH
jgi:hypothetical protein